MPLSYIRLTKLCNELDSELEEVCDENSRQKESIIVLKDGIRTQQAVIESLKLQLKQKARH